MNVDTLRDMIHRVPFVPFGIRMDNGATYPVPDPDYLLVVPGGAHVIVAEDSGRFHILDLPHISSVTLSRTRKRPASS